MHLELFWTSKCSLHNGFENYFIFHFGFLDWSQCGHPRTHPNPRFKAQGLSHPMPNAPSRTDLRSWCKCCRKIISVSGIEKKIREIELFLYYFMIWKSISITLFSDTSLLKIHILLPSKVDFFSWVKKKIKSTFRVSCRLQNVPT